MGRQEAVGTLVEHPNGMGRSERDSICRRHLNIWVGSTVNLRYFWTSKVCFGLPRSFFPGVGSGLWAFVGGPSPGGTVVGSPCNYSKTQEWTRNRSRVACACSRQEKPVFASDQVKAKPSDLDHIGRQLAQRFEKI
jgi:hypothetical protein